MLSLVISSHIIHAYVTHIYFVSVAVPKAIQIPPLRHFHSLTLALHSPSFSHTYIIMYIPTHKHTYTQSITTPGVVTERLLDGYWSTKGCTRDETLSNESNTVCLCDHLTHFAILLSSNPPMVRNQRRGGVEVKIERKVLILDLGTLCCHSN